MGFDCNKWALRELLAKNWNYDGQCSPFQASVIDGMIKKLKKVKNLHRRKLFLKKKVLMQKLLLKKILILMVLDNN